MARSQIQDLKVINVEFFPRESHLATFRDPWSFPLLYHPACNRDVPKHLADIAQKACPPLPSLFSTPANVKKRW